MRVSMSDLFYVDDIDFDNTEKTYGTLPPFPSDGVDDVVVIGAGVAGLMTALNIAPIRPVTVLTTELYPDFYQNSNPGFKPFDAEVLSDLKSEDTPYAQFITQNMEQTSAKLNEFGCTTDMTLDQMHKQLLAAARKMHDIRFVEGYIADTIVTSNGYATGLMAHVVDIPAHQVMIPAHAIVLATGGVSSLFDYDCNKYTTTGIGVALAARAGAKLGALGQIAVNPKQETSLYHVGGVVVDAFGRTTLDKLWACGEAAYFVSGNRKFGRRRAAIETIIMALLVAQDIERSSPSLHEITRDLKIDDKFVFMPENADRLIAGIHKSSQNHLHPNSPNKVDAELLLKFEKAYQILKPVPALGNSALGALLIAADQFFSQHDDAEMKTEYTHLKEIFAKLQML